MYYELWASKGLFEKEKKIKQSTSELLLQAIINS